MHLPVPPEVAFDYLVDPANRAEWQPSLARVLDRLAPLAVRADLRNAGRILGSRSQGTA